MILKQAEFYLDEKKRKYIAYKIIEGSYRNMVQVLKYYSSRGKNVGEQLQQAEQLYQRLNYNMTIEEMMALEGNIRKLTSALLTKSLVILISRLKKGREGRHETI